MCFDKFDVGLAIRMAHRVMVAAAKADNLNWTFMFEGKNQVFTLCSDFHTPTPRHTDMCTETDTQNQ